MYASILFDCNKQKIQEISDDITENWLKGVSFSSRQLSSICLCQWFQWAQTTDETCRLLCPEKSACLFQQKKQLVIVMS